MQTTAFSIQPKHSSFEEVPKRLAVIGGGYIGLEMGMMLSKLGSDVTVIEMADQVLANLILKWSRSSHDK